MEKALLELARHIQKGEDAALALVVDAEGSVPRGAGATMAVFKGSVSGTVGGGAVEFACTKACRKLLGGAGAYTRRFDLSPAGAAELGMVCGGRALVLFCGFLAADTDAQRFCGALLAADENEPLWLGVRFTAAPGAGGCGTALASGAKAESSAAGGDDSCEEAKLPRGAVPGGVSLLLADESGTFVAVMPGENGEDLADGSGEDAMFFGRMLSRAPYYDPYEEGFLYTQPLFGQGVVYIFGCGHVAQKLAAQLALVDFACVVADDRAEFANAERFPTAREVIVAPFPGVFQRFSIKKQDCIIIMTRGHLSDHGVLVDALKTEAGYIGMIGSKRKVAASFTRLIAKDGFTYADTQRVTAPIGIDIGDETPAEIAVSITAQLIKARADERG